MKNVFDIIANPDRRSCTILLYGEIGDYAEVTASDVLTQIMDAEARYERIDIRINSVGGQVSTGIAIFNALKASKSEITIYIDCLAASTASFIASCGRTVKMSRYARLMIHKPTGGVWGNADEIKNYMEQLQRIEDTICDIYAQRTKLPVEEIKATYMDGKDHWLNAEEAVRLGFADEVYDDMPASFEDTLSIDQRCDLFTDLYAGTFNHKTNINMFDRIKKMQQFSDCADETAVMARLAEICKKAEAHDSLQSKVTALEAKVSEYEKKEKAAKDAAIAAEVDAAVKDGRIDETLREKYVKMLNTDEAESARAILASLKPKRHIVDVIDNKPDHEKTAQDIVAEEEAKVRQKYNL